MKDDERRIRAIEDIPDLENYYDSEIGEIPGAEDMLQQYIENTAMTNYKSDLSKQNRRLTESEISLQNTLDTYEDNGIKTL